LAHCRGQWARLGLRWHGQHGVLAGSPLVITEFALDLPSYRSGVQIALFVGIAGLYFWP